MNNYGGSMNGFAEWCFELVAFSSLPEDEHNRLADILLMTAVKWAEEKKLGVGGGFRTQRTKNGFFSIYEFGLSATQDNQFITITETDSLLVLLRSTSTNLGFELVGGYHLYKDDDALPDTENQI
jgi:hypothetical protein